MNILHHKKVMNALGMGSWSQGWESEALRVIKFMGVKAWVTVAFKLKRLKKGLLTPFYIDGKYKTCKC